LATLFLGFLLQNTLYEKFPNDDEGDLSRKRSYLVRKETLSKIAKFYNLGNKIILGEGEKKVEEE
jgi:ribonuclease-3